MSRTKKKCDIVNSDLCDHYYYSKQGCKYKKNHSIICPFDNSEDTRIYKGNEKNGVCPWLGLCDLAIDSNYEYCYGRHTECPAWNEDPYFNTSKECVTK